MEAIQELQVRVCEVPLVSGEATLGIALKVAYIVKAFRLGLRLRGRKVEILCLHPGLLPAALLIRFVLGRTGPVTSFWYGIDIWGAGAFTRRIRRLHSVRSVAISSFSAGALTDGGSALLLPPTVQEKMYNRLVAIPRSNESPTELVVLSVFRLEDYVNKGGPELVSALANLREQGHSVSLIVAGVDYPNDRLAADLDRHRGWMRVIRSPDTDQLLDLYAEASVFVLASRYPPKGEGFGIVLAEAALAGLAVVAPANDGSADAFIPGITGLRPRDQSVGGLSYTLRWIAEHHNEMGVMARNGRAWAREKFDPERYRELVGSVLWGQETSQDWLGVEVRSP
jgi:glycosyltransferase involved in cell wall biosynthesis